MLHRETFELQGLGAFMVALLVVKAWKCPCIRGWENSEEWTQHTKEGQQQWKQKAPSSDITPDAAQKQNTQGNKASHRTRYTPANTMLIKFKNKQGTVGLRPAIHTLKPQRKARD